MRARQASSKGRRSVPDASGKLHRRVGRRAVGGASRADRPERRQPRGAESWAAPWGLGLFTVLLSWGHQVPTRHFLQTRRKFTGKGVDPGGPQGSGFWTRVPRRPFLISRNTRGFLQEGVLVCGGFHLSRRLLCRVTEAPRWRSSPWSSPPGLAASEELAA
eukprot:bmy_18303T0